MPASRSKIRPGGLVKGTVIAAIVAAFAVGTWPLYNQIVTARIAAAAKRVVAGEDLTEVRRWEALCLGVCPVTALVAGGSARAALASRSKSAERVEALDQAETLLVAATKTQPLNGEAWIQLAYVRGLQDLGPSPRMQATLLRSYEVQPFSQQGGMWRIRLCGGYWPLVSEKLHAAAIEEARWRWSIHADERPLILAALPNPEARQALEARIAATPLRPY